MEKSELLHQLHIHTSPHGYPLFIGKHCLADVELFTRNISSKQVLIVTNETIAPLYLSQLQKACSGFQCQSVILPDGEQYKDFEHLNWIYEALLHHHYHRDMTILALGGGVIGDIAGFAASTYQRGVNLIHLPTTLLAQVDASVGGKTAINHPLGKNMIGSFYQPTAVIIDIATLNTLSLRDRCAGFAEIIKYGFLVGGDFLKQLQQTIDDGLEKLSSNKLATLIAQCCQIKAQFIENDAYERGQRALLNLGHTVGHALEVCTHYQRWHHGEAVAIGLYCAALLSHRLGYLSLDDVQLMDMLLSMAALPTRIPKDIHHDDLIKAMYLDKKIKNNQLRFVVIQNPGSCHLMDVSHEMLQSALLSAVEGVS